jgi:hypothetical protein
MRRFRSWLNSSQERKRLFHPIALSLLAWDLRMGDWRKEPFMLV